MVHEGQDVVFCFCPHNVRFHGVVVYAVLQFVPHVTVTSGLGVASQTCWLRVCTLALAAERHTKIDVVAPRGCHRSLGNSCSLTVGGGSHNHCRMMGMCICLAL